MSLTLGSVSEQLRVARDLALAPLRLPTWLSLPHTFPRETFVGDDFFGINVATSEDPRCDDVVTESLGDLGIRHVRIAYGYMAPGAFTERLLDRLLNEDYSVLVALVPPRQDASMMATSADCQARFRAFVCEVFEGYGDAVEAFEIGNTPNRGRWSGYDLVDYLTAWGIASDEASRYDIRLVGPNVSDFEPFYNVGLLKGMRRAHSVPAVQTDNLFIERTIEPEVYDTRALGTLLAGFARLNFAKKTYVLEEIARDFGVERTYCTYNCWTQRRLARWTSFPQEKGADYLTRYLVIAAAAGALNRVYWGPLIDHRDGLIDCGDREYPKVDNVSFYERVRGSVNDFERTEAFGALRDTIACLRGARCVQGATHPRGVSHFVFVRESGEEVHICWSSDRYVFPVQGLYPRGPATQCDNELITERPLILRWPAGARPWRPPLDMIKRVAPLGPKGTVFGFAAKNHPRPISADGWQGVAMVAASDPAAAEALSYLPEALQGRPVLATLRDKRNKLWNVPAPDGEGVCTVKQNRARGIKRVTYLFKPSKAKRHWNNATEMLRRGVNTPRPIAYVERNRWAGVADNYYVTEFVPDAFSTRDLFTSFAAGASEYRGLSKPDWLQAVGEFVGFMHLRRVIHRDLSSGNILITMAGNVPTFYLIDIGRARIDRGKIEYPRPRWRDLMRICYKLEWADREAFVDAYQVRFSAAPRPRWWRAALHSYDSKQRWKKRLKGALRRSSTPRADNPGVT